MGIEVSYTSEYCTRQANAFSGLIEVDQPQIDKFLLFIILVFLFKSRYQGLEGTNHVAEKANSSHFNEHLKAVFKLGYAIDISIPD